MISKSIKTRRFMPPKDDLFGLIRESFQRNAAKQDQVLLAGPGPALSLKKKSIIVITSKIVSIWQGRCVKIEDVPDKDELIRKEAELYLDRNKVPEGYAMLTMKNNIMIPTAGIDESNASDYYILWPEEPFNTAKKIYDFIKEEFGLSEFGIIISDSHTVPLRWGTMGIALSYWGFWPLRDYRGSKDIFGRVMKISQLNIADSIATAAVLTMGEGDEQTPMAVIENLDFIKFGNFDFIKENPLEIKREHDIYGPLLNNIEWEKGEGK